MKTARVQLEGDGLRLRARSGSGHELVVDDAVGDSGPRPKELLLIALAGCTAMDVISILRKKRQPVDDYVVEVEGVERAEHPAAFEEIGVSHSVRGDVDPQALRRAIELSATRYCSVGAGLSSGLARIRHSFSLERPDGTVAGEVVRTGPYRPLDAAERIA